MRGLLRGHADRGGTVLLSSHLLHEVEQTADELVVIGRGRIVASGAKASLVASAGTFVRSADDSRLTVAFRAHGADTHAADGGLVVDLDAARVGELALGAGVALTELRPAGSSTLEDLFLDLTADTQRESAPPPPGPTPGVVTTTEVPA
jgi:ABC-2 type transport system ATP-binding protein